MSLHVPEMYKQASSCWADPEHSSSCLQLTSPRPEGFSVMAASPLSLHALPVHVTRPCHQGEEAILSGYKKAVECHSGGLCKLMLAAVGIGVLEMVVVDRLVDNGPCQEDENVDYVAGDGDIAQDGGDANMGPKEAVFVAEVRSQW